MASSSYAAPPRPPLPSGPCIRALHLNPTSSAVVRDLAQAVKHDQEVSGQHALLLAKTLAEAKSWSSVLISALSWAKVDALRTQLISESDSLIPIVTSINPSALYLYEKAMVVQLHAGVAPLKSFLTMDQDCALLVPLSPTTAPESEDDLLVTVWDDTRGAAEDVYRLALAEGKAFVVSGTANLRVEGDWPLVAVVFCLASGSGGEG